jgi:hypothetical protein
LFRDVVDALGGRCIKVEPTVQVASRTHAPVAISFSEPITALLTRGGIDDEDQPSEARPRSMKLLKEPDLSCQLELSGAGRRIVAGGRARNFTLGVRAVLTPGTSADRLRAASRWPLQSAAGNGPHLTRTRDPFRLSYEGLRGSVRSRNVPSDPIVTRSL